MQKNPGLAAVLSFFIIGLGQIYNGQIGKGLLLFGGAVVSGFLTIIIIGFVILPILWLYGIYDAYKTADALNGQVQ
jgi:TM2 domain-containing membrane protein YozV